MDRGGDRAAGLGARPQKGCIGVSLAVVPWVIAVHAASDRVECLSKCLRGQDRGGAGGVFGRGDFGLPQELPVVLGIACCPHGQEERHYHPKHHDGRNSAIGRREPSTFFKSFAEWPRGFQDVEAYYLSYHARSHTRAEPHHHAQNTNRATQNQNPKKNR